MNKKGMNQFGQPHVDTRHLDNAIAALRSVPVRTKGHDLRPAYARGLERMGWHLVDRSDRAWEYAKDDKIAVLEHGNRVFMTIAGRLAPVPQKGKRNILLAGEAGA